MLDKGFSKAPNLVPRVRPRVRAVEEPKKKLKVDDEAAEEEIVEDIQQEPEKSDQVKPAAGNIIRIPEMIAPEVVVTPTVADCPVVIKDLIKSKFEKGQLSASEIARRQILAEKRKSKVKDEVKVPEDLPIPSVEEEILAPRGPQVRLINGEMVIDENSLTVAAEKEKLEFQRIEEGAARYVSSASFRLRPKTARVKWTQELTDLFYDGLSYFGTDFGLTALLFPGFSRNMIKLKFNSEERTNSSRVNQALMSRKVPGEELKMQMKYNLSLNLEKEEESTQSNNAKTSARKGSKVKNQEEKENAEQQEPEEPAIETIKQMTTVAEKVFQETAQKSFEDAIGNVQSLSSSLSKPGQGPKIAPRVSNRPPRKQKPANTEE